MNRDLKSLLFSFSFVSFIVLPLFFVALSAKVSVHKENKVIGAVELGHTKQQVMKLLGKPNSPQSGDFIYVNKGSELMICFNEISKRVEAIIVRGKTMKYSVSGVRIGSAKIHVRNIYGEPERSIVYKKSGVECWHYPSKNVSFAIKGGLVDSFSVNNCGNGK